MGNSNFLRSGVLYSLICLVFSVFVSSCINDDYNLDNIDGNGVFSPNGISVPAGSFDPIKLVDAQLTGVNNVFVHSIDGFFSESFYDLFVAEDNDWSSGISFEAVVEINIGGEEEEIDPSAYLALETRILDERGNDVGINFGEPNTFPLDKTEHDYKFKISKEDMFKLKNAYSLEYKMTIIIDDLEIKDEDNVTIKDMLFISSNGIHFELDF